MPSERSVVDEVRDFVDRHLRVVRLIVNGSFVAGMGLVCWTLYKSPVLTAPARLQPGVWYHAQLAQVRCQRHVGEKAARATAAPSSSPSPKHSQNKGQQYNAVPKVEAHVKPLLPFRGEAGKALHSLQLFGLTNWHPATTTQWCNSVNSTLRGRPLLIQLVDSPSSTSTAHDEATASAQTNPTPAVVLCRRRPLQWLFRRKRVDLAQQALEYGCAQLDHQLFLTHKDRAHTLDTYRFSEERARRKCKGLWQAQDSASSAPPTSGPALRAHVLRQNLLHRLRSLFSRRPQ